MIKKSGNPLSMETPLDSYEQELSKFIADGNFVSDPHFSARKSWLAEAAKRYLELQETKSITLRIKKKDLIRLKAKAAQKNIPYQTLISILINKYTEGKTHVSL